MTIAVQLGAMDGPLLPPIAALPVVGAPGFTPGGLLLVLERRVHQGWVMVHEFGPRAGGFAPLGSASLRGLYGAPIGCAVSPDGRRLAAGLRTARLFAWPGGAPVGRAPAVRHQLAYRSLGFSPSGALLAVADGGYVSPGGRVVHVCDATDGARLAAVKTREWCFTQVQLLDDSTLVTLGLALDWRSGEPATAGQRVLGCYDVDRRRPRWRRLVRAGQLAGVDGDAGLVWVAGDEHDGAATRLLGLAADDGRVVRTLEFPDGRRPDLGPPTPLGPTTLVVTTTGGGPRLAVVDVDGRTLAALAGSERLAGVELPVAVDRGARRLAAVCGGRTLVWQLP
jgi:hypothetical protein